MTGRTTLALVATAALLSFCLGAAAAGEPRIRVVQRVAPKEVPVVRTVETTPASCRTALDIDNQVFKKMGAALQTLDFDEVNAYMDGVLAERTASYGDCVAKS